jgi:hypothetical protein
MAFSKVPEKSTYQTKQLPLMREYASRASGFSKDADYQNVFFEITKNKTTQENTYDIFPRPGTENFSQILQSAVVRQVYFWEARNKFYVWVNDDIQIVNGTTGVIEATVTGALGTGAGAVGVTEFLYDDGTVKLVFTDGVSLRTIDAANTVVASVSPDLPTPLATHLVFLDGYLFTIKSGTYDIYNSNLNDPLAFTAGDYISSEMVPDPLVAIAKLNNYLVAFGSSSIEYFWDAAEADGSPLARNDTPVKYNGYVGGLSSYGNKLFYIGNNTEGSPAVFMLEDFKIKELANESLRRQLEGEVTVFADWAGQVVSVNGHAFYMVSTTTRTYAIDIETGLWSRWVIAGGSNLTVIYASNAKTTNTYNPVIYLSGSQYLSRFITTVCTDSGTSYTMTLISNNEDFDSMNTKACNRLTVYGDRPSVDTTLTISWSDDDYQNFQTAQTVNLNQELPCIYQCGSFRRRAHKLTCTPTVPFRLRYLELDLNMGNT